MNVEDCSVSLSDCSFTNNSARFEGGALQLQEKAFVILEGSTFIDNYIDIAQTGGGSGGAIASTAGT